MIKHSIPPQYSAKPNRALYLANIPPGTKFHTISNRCFARHEPLGESNGLWLYNFHELEVVSNLKLANSKWYEVRLTENNVSCPTYWVYEHCISPTKFGYIKAKFLSWFR